MVNLRRFVLPKGNDEVSLEQCPNHPFIGNYLKNSKRKYCEVCGEPLIQRELSWDVYNKEQSGIEAYFRSLRVSGNNVDEYVDNYLLKNTNFDARTGRRLRPYRPMQEKR